jgi:hypothetical protein
MNMQFVEQLSLHEQFRLVEIAHETSDRDIKKAALTVLQKYLNPLVTFTDEAGNYDAQRAAQAK